MQTKGKWNIQNLGGVFKNFASSETPDALAWMRNKGDSKQVWNKHSEQWEVDEKTQEKLDKKAAKAA